MSEINKKPVSVFTFQNKKQKNEKITALTAYDYSTAKYLDESGIDFILVGDSLAMVALGHETTHSVTVDEMLVFTKAVSRGAKRTMVIADMPFMSYQTDVKTAVKNAGRFIKEGGARAVKMEGCSNYMLEVTQRTVEAGIPVLAHLGFTPQFLHTLGGYAVQGKILKIHKKLLNRLKLWKKPVRLPLCLKWCLKNQQKP